MLKSSIINDSISQHSTLSRDKSRFKQFTQTGKVEWVDRVRKIKRKKIEDSKYPIGEINDSPKQFEDQIQSNLVEGSMYPTQMQKSIDKITQTSETNIQSLADLL